MKVYLTENIGYDIVYADPPWQKKKGGLRKSRPNQTRDLDYQTIPLKEIKELLASVNTSEKHNFFVWTVDEFLHDTEGMMAELGYKLHARLIWDKENGVAPAFTVRYSHEYLLWGSPPRVRVKLPKSTLTEIFVRITPARAGKTFLSFFHV